MSVVASSGDELHPVPVQVLNSSAVAAPGMTTIMPALFRTQDAIVRCARRETFGWVMDATRYPRLLRSSSSTTSRSSMKSTPYPACRSA